MKTPCCKKQINQDKIWDLIAEDTDGVTNKSINCPYCEKPLTVFLDIYSLEEDF